jgi:transposase
MADDSDDGEATAHMSSHMSSRTTTRIEVIGRVSGRRRWTVEHKLAILRDAFGPEGAVRTACERHEVGSGQLYTWRRQAMSGELTGIKAPALPAFAEVEVSEPTAPVVPAFSHPGGGGQIGIELPSGVRLTVDAAVDADALARVIGVLSR